MKTLNWNCNVKVKLTDYGKDIYYHQFDYLIAKGIKVERGYPQQDENGYTTMQLWCFMELYGQYIGMCLPRISEDITFYIEEEDLKEK